MMKLLISLDEERHDKMTELQAYLAWRKTTTIIGEVAIWNAACEWQKKQDQIELDLVYEEIDNYHETK